VKSRASLILSVLLIAGVFNSPSASAANLAGTKCTKPGQIKTASKITYVCAKVGKTSTWIQAGNSGSSTKPSATPSAKPTIANCTTGIGTNLSPQLVNDADGLAMLQIRNPFNCTISYNISGQVTCRHYKSARTVLPAIGSGSLAPNQVATLRPQQAFQVADQSCQQLQKSSGAGPEYGAGILSFSNFSNMSAFTYQASVVAISN
jgi:hypothetical protein